MTEEPKDIIADWARPYSSLLSEVRNRKRATLWYLEKNHPECFTEAKHKNVGTPENTYSLYGYALAMQEVEEMVAIERSAVPDIGTSFSGMLPSSPPDSYTDIVLGKYVGEGESDTATEEDSDRFTMAMMERAREQATAKRVRIPNPRNHMSLHDGFAAYVAQVVEEMGGRVIRQHAHDFGYRRMLEVAIPIDGKDCFTEIILDNDLTDVSQRLIKRSIELMVEQMKGANGASPIEGRASFGKAITRIPM